MQNRSRAKYVSYVRNFIFGVEDSLVSTVGLLAGVAVAGVARPELLMTGIVLIFVEAFSMGVGSLLSDNTASEYLAHKEVPLYRSFISALIMFCSYFIAGFIPLIPYVLILGNGAVAASVAASLVSLFMLGFISGTRVDGKGIREGFKMAILGGLAIIVGMAIGNFVSI